MSTSHKAYNISTSSEGDKSENEVARVTAMNRPIRVKCLVWYHSVLVARFGEKAVLGSRVLMGVFCGSLWQEGSYGEPRAGGNEVTQVLWWLCR